MAFLVQQLIVCFVVLNIVSLSFAIEEEFESESNNTCSTQDLNHSVLVECKLSDCHGVGAQLWPEKPETIIHMYSTRSGDRFAFEELKNVNYTETNEQKWYDINTTLYVDTKKPKFTNKARDILGFGAKFDSLKKFGEVCHGDDGFSIIRDLFAKDQFGIRLNILVLPVTIEEFFARSVQQLLKELDGNLMTKEIGGIQVILQFEKIDQSILDPLELLKKSFDGFSTLKHLIIAVPKDLNTIDSYYMPLIGAIEAIVSRENVFSHFGINRLPDTLADISNDRYGVNRMLIKSNFAAPYDILNRIQSKAKQMSSLIVIADNKPYISDERRRGDWQTAQHYAVEILKHLETGVNAFVEDSTMSDVLTPFEPHDSSIYSLHGSGHMLHFRGPMFYAIGHFSRYLLPGSKLLTTNVFTQPNMFAAHYQAFLTPQNQVVAIILNHNEHLLPFRLALDDRIITNTFLKPKSFNTIVLNA